MATCPRVLVAGALGGASKILTHFARPTHLPARSPRSPLALCHPGHRYRDATTTYDPDAGRSAWHDATACHAAARKPSAGDDCEVLSAHDEPTTRNEALHGIACGQGCVDGKQTRSCGSCHPWCSAKRLAAAMATRSVVRPSAAPIAAMTAIRVRHAMSQWRLNACLAAAAVCTEVARCVTAPAAVVMDVKACHTMCS